MTSDDLAAAGEALLGPLWQSELSRLLEVNDRTVRRWVSGETPPPEWLAAELRKLLNARKRTIEAALKRLGDQ